MSQEEMLQKMGAGDREAFREFYQETARSVYSFILSLTKSPTEAEDLMQETYLSVWTKADSYVPQGKPLAWVFTIARNLCYMRFREQRQRSDVALEELEGREEGRVCDSLEQAADRKVLLDALSKISREERQIVLLHAAAGMKHREVAEALEMPLATELSKYNRSMKKLQTILQCR
ncbi:MAG: RNA polymerase sigma factor [Clostridium sp.]|nr:RNA polymerase sigma factor [Clostridium sp.]